MVKNLYYIIRCVQCGDMPLFLIFYQDKRGKQEHFVMLCTFKNLRLLLRQKRGFTEPEKYGHIVYKGHSEKPNDVLAAMLKARYGFDFNQDSTDNVQVV